MNAQSVGFAESDDRGGRVTREAGWTLSAAERLLPPVRRNVGLHMEFVDTCGDAAWNPLVCTDAFQSAGWGLHPITSRSLSILTIRQKQCISRKTEIAGGF